MQLAIFHAVLIIVCFLGTVDAFNFAPLLSLFRAGPGWHAENRRCKVLQSAIRSQASIRMMEEIEEIVCDVAIIGGGPAGCTCALYTARAEHKTVVIDKSPAIGALARTDVIANYPGVDSTMNGRVLLDMMREQAVQYGTDYRRAQVFEVDTDEGFKMVYTPEVTVKAKTLVLATGAMGREPYFKNEDKYLGQGVSYCATCDAAFYKDRPVAVVGTNPEAIEEALFLTKFASTVHWITATEEYANYKIADDLLSVPNVKQWEKTRMSSIEGDDSGVTGIEIKAAGADPEILPVDGVFIYISGAKPITDFCEEFVDLKKGGGVITDDQMMTSVDGVFAIGDIRDTPYKQAVGAASDGCIAAMAIDRYLRGRKSVRVDWVHK